MFAPVTDEPTGAAVAGWLTFLTLIALGFGGSAHLLESVLDVEQVVDNRNAPCRSGTPFWGRGVRWRQLGQLMACPCGLFLASGWRHFSQKTWKHWSILGSAYGCRHIPQVSCSSNFSRACLVEGGSSAIALQIFSDCVDTSGRVAKH